MRQKLAVIADSHFDEAKRFEECIRIHDWIRQDAAERGCTAWSHAGDVYERRSTPREREAVAEWTQGMARDVGPGVIVRGNHDGLDDLPLLQRLDTDGRSVHVVETVGALSVGGFTFGCLAWPQRAQLMAALADVGAEATELAAGDALRNVLRGLGQQMAEGPDDAPRILLSHAMVRGSRVSTGQPLIGMHFELGLDDLALADADFYALGHVHMQNVWDISGAPVVYPGSPRRTAFGELEAKGYIVAEFDGRKLVGWEHVETPCAPMYQVTAAWDGKGLEFVVDNDLVEYGYTKAAGAEVRLRYSVPSDQRETARADAAFWRDRVLEAGAVTCKVEEVVEATTRARAPEVAAATTPTDKLAAYWAATGFDPGSRRESLVSKFEEAQAQCNSAQ